MNKITHFHYCQGLEQQPLLNFQIGNTRGVRAPPGGLITNLIIVLVIHQPTLMQINWRPGEHTALPIKYCYDLSRYHSIYLHMYVHLQIQGKIWRRSHFAKVIRSAKIPSANAMHFSITFNLSWKTQGTKFCRPNYFFRASKVQCAILRSDRLAI